MRLDEKSESFKFHKNIFATKKDHSSPKKCRKKLQDRFDDTGMSSKNNRSVLSVLTLNNSRRIFRTGADKLHKGMNDFRTSLTNLSQRFRGTRRRHILEESNCTPNCAATTPVTFSKTVLGRTPTKLYSPFGIESPYTAHTSEKHNEINSLENDSVIKEKKSKSEKLKRLIMMR